MLITYRGSELHQRATKRTWIHLSVLYERDWMHVETKTRPNARETHSVNGYFKRFWDYERDQMHVDYLDAFLSLSRFLIASFNRLS